jgi:hypothetical protein
MKRRLVVDALIAMLLAAVVRTLYLKVTNLWLTLDDATRFTSPSITACARLFLIAQSGRRSSTRHLPARRISIARRLGHLFA